MVVYPRNNRLLGLAVHNRLFYTFPFRSLLRLTFLLSLNKQTSEKL